MDQKLATRVGVVVAVGVILYCMYRLRSCKDTYAVLADDTDAEMEYEDSEDDYEDSEMEYEASEDEYDEPEGPDDAYTLMEPTMDDSRANAMFEPGM